MLSVKPASTPIDVPDTGASHEIWGMAEMAEFFEVTPRTIRFYEEQGLIRPKRAGGRRIFNLTDRVRLNNILRAKRIGFSLEDIKRFMDVADGRVRERAHLLSRKAEFEAVIERLQRKRKDIDVIARDMQELCALIDTSLEEAPQAGVFQFAEAYQARLAAHLDEDFLEV